MRRVYFSRYIVAVALSVLTLAIGYKAIAAPPACTGSPLSTGANIATAVSSASNGDVICLNSGNYGTVDLFDIGRSGFVTLRSTTGAGAIMNPRVGNSDYIKFNSMTLNGGLVNSCSTHVYFIDTPFVVDGGGLMIDASACGSGVNDDYLIDGATFDRVQQANEGRVGLRDVNGMTITNSNFTGVSSSSPSDGIQTQGNTRNLTISNNNFSGILESLCGATHCDSIQLQGGGTTVISGNYFKNADTFILASDGSSNVTATNNVFDGTGVGYDFNIQFGTAANLTFTHNTLIDSSIAVDDKVDPPDAPSTNAEVHNNILDGNTTVKTSGGGGCTSCDFSFNMFDDNPSATGSNNVVGTPLYQGDSSLNAWGDYGITSSSPGYHEASDGGNMGIQVGAVSLLGDLDSSGSIDQDDLDLLKADYGKTSGITTAGADINNDGRVDAFDLSILLRNWTG